MGPGDPLREVPAPADVWVAARRLAPVLAPSPLRRSLWLEEVAGRPVYLKLESVQPTGSFKVRGAHNRLLARRESGLGDAGVITASSGNHGAALAFAAQATGTPVTVVVPTVTSAAKLASIRRYGAEIITHGVVYDEAEDRARCLAARRGLEYISAFADPEVIAGQGTLALEILAQLGRIGSIVIPVGGGGLIGGVALAARVVAPGVKVIGVQPEASRAMFESFRAGRLVEVDHHPTLSDGTVGGIAENTLALVLKWVDEVVLVTEPDLAWAMRELLFRERAVVEGAGALSVAALLAGVLPEALPDPMVFVLSGSNVDTQVLLRVLRAAPPEER